MENFSVKHSGENTGAGIEHNGNNGIRNDGIRDRCRVNTNKDADVFVGIKCEKEDISIHFPLGFEISAEEKELRKDILLLINTIAATTAKKESEIPEAADKYNQTAFPIQAYMSILYDFYARGYYREKEVVHTVAKRGKIDWNRTIKTQRPQVQDDSIFYLDFVTRKNSINEDELITRIHEYCVYESFSKIGWLFTAHMPARPRLKYNEKLFRRVLMEKYSHTFNDRNKRLFRNMLAVVNYQGDKDSSSRFQYGTYRFEYVWETLIDRVYGIDNKEDYFPRTAWILDSKRYRNSPLRPDTIMIHDGNIYVLDAKYYKYGATGKPGDLPDSESIGKQITYGEYIAGQQRFRAVHGEDYKVYNAFLMPFAAMQEKGMGNSEMIRIGEAVSEWKNNEKSYEKVQGVLIDIKGLMKISVRQEQKEILKLAECIRQYVEEGEKT